MSTFPGLTFSASSPNRRAQKKSFAHSLSGLVPKILLTSISLVGFFSIVATQPPPPTTTFETFVSIPLGNGSNAVSIAKPFFLGHRVESVRLRVRFHIPNRTNHWINGVTLRVREAGATGVVQQFANLPTTAAADGSFWTRRFNGNAVWISIFSSGIIGFDGGQPEFQILEVDRRFEPATSRDDVPAANLAGDNHLNLSPGHEAIAHTPGTSESQHFAINTWAYTSQRFAIYASPFLPDLGNDVGLRLSLSVPVASPNGVIPATFRSPSDEGVWERPAGGDSGIYYEFVVPPKTPHVLITVNSALRAPYFLSVNRVRKIFYNVVMERDEEIGTPAATNDLALRNLTSNEFPYGWQLADFLPENPNIDQRIEDVTVLASAYMLDASDGMFRFGGAKLYRNISWSRNVDVQFKKGEGRANAGAFKITMFEDDELQEPLGGGWTFHHEWGHWEYNMPDEYIDVSGPPPLDFSLEVDPNSVMGTRATTEFCHEDNHQWTEDAGNADEESMWQLLVDQYEVLPGQDSGGLNQGRYLDVLNQLNKLLEFRVYD